MIIKEWQSVILAFSIFYLFHKFAFSFKYPNVRVSRRVYEVGSILLLYVFGRLSILACAASRIESRIKELASKISIPINSPFAFSSAVIFGLSSTLLASSSSEIYSWANLPVLRRKLICWRVVAWMVTGIIAFPCFSYGIRTKRSSCLPTATMRRVIVSKYLSPEYLNMFSIFASSNPLRSALYLM